MTGTKFHNVMHKERLDQFIFKSSSNDVMSPQFHVCILLLALVFVDNGTYRVIDLSVADSRFILAEDIKFLRL